MTDSCVIGVDLGGTKLNVGAFDRDLTVHHSVQLPAPTEREAVIDTVVAAVEQVRAAVDLGIVAVGLGIPCLIDQRTGMAVMAVNLPVNDLPFRDLVTERLGLPVVIDNDANVAALAEQRFGAAKGASDIVLLTVGTGIGGGLVLSGEVYRGSVGAGAELGHMVIEADGPPCQGNCPNRGCLEAVASGTALAREAEQAALADPESPLGQARAQGEELSGAFVTQLALDGDQLACDLIASIGHKLGIGVANYVNIFNPEFVVIGGGVIAAGEILLAPVRAVVAERALKPSRDLVQIVPAHFGPEAGMVGAAALAFSALERTA